MKRNNTYYLVLTNIKNITVQEMTVQSSKRLDMSKLVEALLPGSKLGTHHRKDDGTNFYLIEDKTGVIGAIHYAEV